MAKKHYSADSARDHRPLLLTAVVHGIPPGGVAARMASALPSCHAGVTAISVTRS